MSNINTLDRHQTKDAISMLENLISAELKEAVVRRLDFAATLNVTQQVNSYYPFLGNRAYLPRIQTTEDTLEYRNSNRGIIFYDKGKEEKIFNENLMRVECRWMKATLVRLLSKGERGIVTVADILDKNNFSFFIKQWQNEYIEIEKIRKLVFDLTNVQPKDVISILALAGIGSFGGLDKFLEIISASLGISEKHNKFLPRVRDMLYDRYNNDKFTTKQSTIHELDELMEVHAKQCLEINK
ncbi:MAG: hypothetical protein P4L41_02975 [Flavipsychrobacter sp.]|nr:hypothetical protein [Flavipsychrobacter sp.]